MSLLRALNLAGILTWSSLALAQSSNPPAAQTANSSNSNAGSQLPNAPSPAGTSSPAPSSSPAKPEPSAARSQSSSSSLAEPAPRYWAGNDPAAHVTVLENTLFRVLTNDPLSTRETRVGAALLFTLSEDIVVDGAIVIPRGAVVHGTVTEVKQPGTLTGSPELVLQLTSLDLGTQSDPFYTYLFQVAGASKTRPTETRVKDGAVIGAIAGGIFSGSAKGSTSAVGKLAGMGTGAVLGAGVGIAVSAVTPGPILSIPAESQMDFYLAFPISVVPLSPHEAQKLSEGLRQGGPVLYVRGDTP
jgi:hypothetical protein